VARTITGSVEVTVGNNGNGIPKECVSHLWSSGVLATGCTNFDSIAFLEVNAKKFSDHGVQHNKTYRYRVYAESNQGPSGFSNIAEVMVP